MKFYDFYEIKKTASTVEDVVILTYLAANRGGWVKNPATLLKSHLKMKEAQSFWFDLFLEYVEYLNSYKIVYPKTAPFSAVHPHIFHERCPLYPYDRAVYIALAAAVKYVDRLLCKYTKTPIIVPKIVVKRIPDSLVKLGYVKLVSENYVRLPYEEELKW